MTIIIIVRTKGKAGYLVWKLAGGQGDQDINLPWGSLVEINFFVFKDLEVLSAKPLLIVFLLKSNINKNKKEECRNCSWIFYYQDFNNTIYYKEFTLRNNLKLFQKCKNIPVESKNS